MNLDHRAQLAAASRDGHLALRRVERQQALIERLHAAHGERLPLAVLARDLGVSARTVARDVERLRLSGVPLDTHPGRGGGISLPHSRARLTLTLDLPEAAALLSSLTVLGPTASPSAASAMRKLVAAPTAGAPAFESAPDAAPPDTTPPGTALPKMPAPAVPGATSTDEPHPETGLVTPDG